MLKYLLLINCILILLLSIIIVYLIYLKIKKKNIKELFTDIKDNKYIITLSTIPVNFDTILPKTIESLLNIENFNQVEKIIINIPKKYSFRLNNQTIEEKKITEFKEKYKNTKIYINILENDYGPGTKIIGSLEKNLIDFDNDNLYIIIVDDDSIYKKDLITSFEKHNKNNLKKIEFASGCTYLNNNVRIGKGVCGIYIKSPSLKNFMNYYNKIKNLDYVLYHDDIYISYYFYLYNIIIYDTKMGQGGWINSRIDNDTQLHKIGGKYRRQELNIKVVDILQNTFEKKDLGWIMEKFEDNNPLYKLLETYNFDKKIRLGTNEDGGYVIADLDELYDCYISCGISNEASFDRDFLKKYNNIGKNNSYAFDGTIKDYPWQYTTDIQFIKKNISNINDDNNTNLDYLINNNNNIFLAIDIEGGEYPWILSLNQKDLNKFKQICIEFHGLNDNSWGTQLKDKIKCLKKLSDTHYLIHAHGNNNSGIQNSIPDVLELTYVNRNYFKEIPSKNNIPFPIKDLDYPNKKSKKDYILDTYPFVEKI